MTTTITTPTDDDSYPTPDFDERSPTDGAQLMFSPESSAAAGQFDTEADQPR